MTKYTKDDVKELENNWDELVLKEGVSIIKTPSNKAMLKIHAPNMRKAIFISLKEQLETLKELINSSEAEEALELIYP